MNLSFRHLAATATGLTFVLILLGVYTGAAGAGLACAGRWPFCDGWLGLFPATWPSFIEWFHRLVAMITGFVILGTAYAAWRDDHGKTAKYATAAAVVVLPVQILLGANTIFNFGAIAQVLHHAAALLILCALVVTTTVAFVRGGRPGAAPGTETTSAARADD